ncbi:MAG: nuclear transport factor 2 family protein [Candidatus Limnocylindria bacterium]
MDNEAMERRLREMYASGDVEALAKRIPELASKDLVQEWPQSGERIRGLDNVMAVNEHYEGATGTAPRMTLRRIVKPGQAWIAEATIDYGDGTPVSLVSILETDADGRITRETDYFANPFEAPEWRSQWVERMEPVPAG